jgi:O-antigen/teichoic acid export membrane protein
MSIVPGGRTGERRARATALANPSPLCRERLRLFRRRSLRDSLFRNSFFIMLTTILTAGLGALFWIIAAHLYSTEEVGLAAALVSAMGLTALLSTFGLQGALVHRLPHRAPGVECSKTLTAGLLTAGGVAALGAVVVVFALPAASPRFDVLEGHVAYGAAFGIGVLATTLSTVFDSLFIAERAAGNMLARNTVLAVVKVLLVAVTAGLASTGAIGILGSWVVATAAGLGAAYFFARRLRRDYRIRWGAAWDEIRAMMPALPAQHGITVAGAVPAFALPLLVATRLSVVDNAHFYTAWMVGSLFFIISPAVSWSLFAEGRRPGADLRPVVRRGALFTAAVLLPLILAFVFGGHLVLTLFGSSYAAQGTGLLVILALSAIPDAVTNLFVGVARVRGTLGPALVVNAGMALETLALAWLLLPSLGIAGAGWAWLIAQLTGSAFVAAWELRRRGRGAGAAPRRLADAQIAPAVASDDLRGA